MTDANCKNTLTIKSRDWFHRSQCTVIEESESAGSVIDQIIKDSIFDTYCMMNILERDTQDLQEELYA